MPQILILAAGSSSRMRGGDKLLEDVAGEPLLRRIVRFALQTGQPVTVALPPDRPLRRVAVQDLPVQVVTAAEAHLGMSASLQAGLRALPEEDAVMLLLADLPEITAQDLLTMLEAAHKAPDKIHRARDATGQPGHPVIFPAWARADLLALSGDEGARQVLARHRDRVHLVPLPGAHATTDLDTPEDWAAWRARQA